MTSLRRGSAVDMVGLPDGLSPVEATMLEAYAANGDVIKFKELANTLPTTAEVLSWISNCLKSSAGPPPSAGRRLGSPINTETTVSIPPNDDTPSGSAVDGPAPSTRKRKHSPMITDFLSTPRRKTANAAKAATSTSTDSVASGSHRIGNESPEQKRKTFLTALIKRIPISEVRELLWWNTNYHDVRRNVAGDTPEWYYDDKESYMERFKKIGHPAVRKLLADAALAHDDIVEQVVGSVSSELVLKTAQDDSCPTICDYFSMRVRRLTREKYGLFKDPRKDAHLKEAARNATEIGNMLDVMYKWATAEGASFEVRSTCLRAATAILTSCTARTVCLMVHCFKSDHVVQWSNYVRDFMGELSSRELTGLRITGYDKDLLRLWQNTLNYDDLEIMPGARARAIADERKHGYIQPHRSKFWPEFGKDTMEYFASRTGGWGEDWNLTESGVSKLDLWMSGLGQDSDSDG